MPGTPELVVEPSWQAAHHGACVGLLSLSAIEPRADRASAFAARRAALEGELWVRFAAKSRAELLAELPALQAYAAYYRRFKKTYHVLLQLESVVFKGRTIASATPLVEAAFMAELQSQLLTATHDLDAVTPPLRLLSAAGDERYPALNGEEIVAKAGDMLMADAAGPICTVIAGQARRGSVQPNTTRALFVVYAPAGIAPASVEQQLTAIADLVRLFAPRAAVENQRVEVAD